MPVTRYMQAFLRGDLTEIERLVEAAAAGPRGVEGALLAAQADTEAYHGRLAKAQEFSQRAIEFALRSGDPETAADYQASSGG